MDVYRCRVCGEYVEEPRHCGVDAELVLDGKTRVKISKLLSLALRHSPSALGVSLDEGGWAPLDAVVAGLKKLGLSASAGVVEAVARLDKKGRFELSSGRIRARYGHSISVKVEYEVDTETRRLYHGTTRRSLEGIMKMGILPMNRLYVHLAVDFNTACETAARRQDPVVLEVDADCTRAAGPIYKASPAIRLSKYIPPTCIANVYPCEKFYTATQT